MSRLFRKRWLVRAALVLTLFLMFIEICLRIVFGLGDAPLVDGHPSIEYMMRPNQNVKRFGNRIQINQFGMRSEEFEKRKSRESEFRVLVLGDSVINGGAPTDQDDLATSLLRENLQIRLAEKTVVVGNISAGSWGPGNLLAYVEAFGLFDADVVAIVLSSHDLYDLPEFGPLDPTTHPLENYQFATIELLHRYLGVALWRNSGVSRIRKAKQRLSKSEKEVATEAALLKLYEIVCDSDAEMAFFLHPELTELESGEYRKEGNFLREICARCNIEFIPLLPVYQRLNRDHGMLYRDYIHPNARGQEVISQELFNYVMRSKVFSTLSQSTLSGAGS